MTIPYGRQEITAADIKAVVEVLQSDYLTQGPMVPVFERTIAEYCGVATATAVNSATSALHLACMALGVGPGDLVWTSPITFVASANCARYCGADVDFVDIDAKTYNMSTERLAEKLEVAKKSGRLPKVVIPVHLAGQSCDMKTIGALAKQYGFKVIEDASHAIGARYLGEPVGNCRYSDITVFSFHPVKIVTSGEGGVAVTNDAHLHMLMERLRSHGVTRDTAQLTKPTEGPWYYEQIELGFNYRMTDIYAALGASQMSRVDEYVERRQQLAHQYDLLFANKPIKTPWQHPDTYSSFHLYIVRPDFKAMKTNQREVFERLRANGVLANLHYIPVYRQPYYAVMGFDARNFPEAESYYSEAISLPLYPLLTDAQQIEVVQKLMTPLGHQTIF
jgi:UDP-4-amino-4,6-dideoxy-N-acetyl-beta-L-altrosamine transaminase